MSDREASLAPLHCFLAEAISRLRRAPDVVHIAVMPDVHLASEVCIGVARATETLIDPQAGGVQGHRGGAAGAGGAGEGEKEVEADRQLQGSVRGQRCSPSTLTSALSQDLRGKAEGLAPAGKAQILAQSNQLPWRDLESRLAFDGMGSECPFAVPGVR